MESKKKIGLIINPIAGMGGSVGLKGTDGEDILRKAIGLGAIPMASKKVATALSELSSLKNEFILITCPGDMGQKTVESLGFDYQLIHDETKTEYPAQDTVIAARTMKNLGTDIILFAGGDGTARDVYNAVNNAALVLGIPAGVKIHSGVFASNPLKAGYIIKDFIKGRLRTSKEAEVMDIDEDLYRQGILTTRLYGYLKIPSIKQSVQNRKTGSMPGEAYSQDAIAHDVIEKMNDGSYFLIGPGTTTQRLMSKLNLEGTLLGVDLVGKNRLLGKDLNENQILDRIRYRKVKLIITPTGGQGFILGRGNQQLSCKVLRIIGKDNILVLATPEKISNLSGQPFLLDTGDPVLDGRLSGYYKVITGYHQYIIYKAIA